MHLGAMPRSSAIAKNAERIDCMLKHDRAPRAKTGVFQRNRSNTVFDETIPLTVAAMTGGISVQDGVTSIVQQMNAVTACSSGDHSGYYQRFPLALGQTDYLDAPTCAAYTSNMNAIKAKIATNNRSKYES